MILSYLKALFYPKTFVGGDLENMQVTECPECKGWYKDTAKYKRKGVVKNGSLCRACVKRKRTRRLTQSLLF